MKLITVAGPPAVGKTSVLLRMNRLLKEQGIRSGVVKFDCMQTNDDEIFQEAGIRAVRGISAELCPDHFFITNLDEVCAYGRREKLDILFTESAGLCSRCSPYLKGIPAVCVVDQLAGIHAPSKIGPMLKLADIVLITRGDIVSQAEREVFLRQVMLVNPRAEVFPVNGLTGQGARAAVDAILRRTDMPAEEPALRFPMPMAICSYCLGETRIGKDYQVGNVRKMNLGGAT